MQSTNHFNSLDDLAKYFRFESSAKLLNYIYSNKNYSIFTINKKNGSKREIAAPADKLKKIQRLLLKEWLPLSSTKEPVHGFTNNRSVVTNAKTHSSKKPYFVLNIDLKDFFGSISFYRIRGLLLSSKFKYPYEVATVIAHICCKNAFLPQGAPTSPFLSNLICKSMDSELQILAKKNRAVYTRYADDITFSFYQNSKHKISNQIISWSSDGAIILGNKLLEIIKKNSFTINDSKTRWMNKYQRMEVTGLTINQFPNVKREYINRIRIMLHTWKKFGYKNAEKTFHDTYNTQKNRHSKPSFSDTLHGKLSYLYAVKDKSDPVYNALAIRFNELANLDNFQKRLPISNQPIDVHNLFEALIKMDK